MFAVRTGKYFVCKELAGIGKRPSRPGAESVRTNSKHLEGSTFVRSYAYGGDSLSYSQLERIVSACDRFEESWRRGEGPRIEDFLTEPDVHDALLERLLLIELDFRRGAGESPTPDEYRARFAGDLNVVGAVFAAEPLRSDGSDTDSDRDSFLGPCQDGSTLTEPDTSNAALLPSDGEPKTEHASYQSTKSFNRTPSEAPGDDAHDSGPGSPAAAGADPTNIGRYTVLRRLGSGGFGTVYLAHDADLNRTVAIKIPHQQSFGSNRQAIEFLNEARVSVQVQHPGIVSVYDVGREQDGSIFIVLEYVDGLSLSEILKRGDYSIERLVDILARVAEAVHHAHKCGLVHRDLKPSNILLDAAGNPHVADFGLAVRDDVHRFRAGEVAGTAPYMAPEQVRGETHRLDGRTDVWALGVTLYRVLTGRRPFSGSLDELIDEIRYREPKPPRQIIDTVPKELERICLKCLSKRMTDRYSSALDLAEDLRAWSSKPHSPVLTSHGLSGRSSFEPETHVGIVRIGPKGLRAFERSDAGSYLTLLPGPRSRDGLPESIVFWKTRIEDRLSETAFSVGLLYGPSGSGKSSLLKAGILPSLEERVRPVYVEASPGRTEARLLAALKRACPGLASDCGLAEATTAIRAGDVIPKDQKVLIILDQFEQWFHAHPDEPHRELEGALRQCDGRRLQALLLVRVDFWMAVTRFFRELDNPLIEGENSAPVEPFDTAHGRKVLLEFGLACGRLSDRSADMAPGSDPSKFLDKAISEMTGPDGHIMPVPFEPLRRDGAQTAVDTRHAERAGRHRGGRRDFPRGNVLRTLGSAGPSHS